MKSIDLSAVKAALCDLDEIGRALSVERPGAEDLALAIRAAARFKGFLDTVPSPTIGIYSALDGIERCLLRQKQPPQFFEEPGFLGQLVASAREDHVRLRLYVETLLKAWKICALSCGWADRKAAGC